jgi:citronellol/citronellal dehydrogenase
MDTYPEPVKAVIRGLHKHLPAARLGTESEVSAAVVFLLSEAAAFITGSCLRVDGGAPNARRHWPLSTRGPAPEYHGFHRATRPTVLGD